MGGECRTEKTKVATTTLEESMSEESAEVNKIKKRLKKIDINSEISSVQNNKGGAVGTPKSSSTLKKRRFR